MDVIEPQCLLEHFNVRYKQNHLFILWKILEFFNHNGLGFIVKFFQWFAINNTGNERMLKKR